MRSVLMAATVAASLTGPALADDPVGKPIDLKTVVVDEKGEALKDTAQRRDGFVVTESFSFGGKDYKPGDKVTDKEEIARMVAYLSDSKQTFKVKSIDPDCAECAQATVGWAMVQAIESRPCSTNGSPQCTPDEKKSEDDPLVMWGRYQEAKKLATEVTATFTPHQIDVMKNLILFRFQGNPVIISQLFPAIDPGSAPTAWDK